MREVLGIIRGPTFTGAYGSNNRANFVEGARLERQAWALRISIVSRCHCDWVEWLDWVELVRTYLRCATAVKTMRGTTTTARMTWAIIVAISVAGCHIGSRFRGRFRR